MKNSYVVREFDPYDNYTFCYHVFSSKAIAKSFARHAKSPFNVGVNMWKTAIVAPLMVKIDMNNPVFANLERDGYELE